MSLDDNADQSSKRMEGLRMRKSFFQFRGIGVVLIGGALALAASLALRSDWQSVARADEDAQGPEASRIVRGFQISPVELDLGGKNRALVGLGSYLVNARGACNDCHTQPAF